MSSSLNARELVLETLLLITRDGEYSHIALKNVLDKYQYLDKKERAFITRVVEGTLERMIEIDYVINQFSKVKVNKMKPVIRTILRSAVYQIKYMDSVPDSAVCNEAVKLAAKKGFVNLKGFVNGVLRNISRNISSVTYPPEEKTEEYLSVSYSLPVWLVKQWLSEYDRQTVEQMGKAFLQERPTCIRCNLDRISKEELVNNLRDEGVTVTEDPCIPYALYIADYDYLAKLESFRKGFFYVQDISSMKVAEWAEPQKGDTVLDVCAAPGGKAIHFAEKLSGTGKVIARDLTDHKVRLIEENIERSGFGNIEAERWDATVYDEKKRDLADIVIADLPCSGLGVLGKKTDLKYKMNPDTQNELVKLQRQILSVVHAYVKPGGKLLYSTCTIHRKENEENTNWFLKEYPQFALIKEQQMLPGKSGGDGFYIAMFQREVMSRDE
ncbi:MAG: 16S rRNA (cytosine(967)-C(5))-methyltransferase RsmB [Lachnospiraceae bacterium]